MAVLHVQVVDLCPQRAILRLRSIALLLGLLEMCRCQVLRQLQRGELAVQGVVVKCVLSDQCLHLLLESLFSSEEFFQKVPVGSPHLRRAASAVGLLHGARAFHVCCR